MHGVLWVGLGGFVGAILRYLVVGWIAGWTKGINFPHGTLAANLIGCFIIGLLSHFLESRSVLGVEARLFIFMGVLGAFTTFSTFENETLNLLRTGNTLLALSNMTMHVVLVMVWLGRALAELVWR